MSHNNPQSPEAKERIVLARISMAMMELEAAYIYAEDTRLELIRRQLAEYRLGLESVLELSKMLMGIHKDETDSNNRS